MHIIILFTRERGCGLTKLGMAAKKEEITADSAISELCHLAFNDAVKKEWHLKLNVLLASPALPICPEGPDRAVATFARNIFETLGRG